MDLKVKNFQEKLDIAKSEHDVLTFWEKTRAFERSVESRPQNKRYVFYDGPPFATGLPHYGHILASTIKDVIPRYWTMKGYRVDRVWGWDCHGIPIENMIEKELGLKGGKKGIEEMGIDKFNAACKAAILRFDKEWEKVIRRIGRWVDFKHSYKTMDKTYMESVWWAFTTLHEKGLVYEGKRVILYCPRCATPLSNFEIAMDNSYKEMAGPSTVYKYKVKEQKNTYFLAWSTTPWNKLATPALAVHPDFEYVKVKQGDEYFILAKNTLKMLAREHYEVVEKYKGRDLEKFTFELHYDFYPRTKDERAGVIIADDYVTQEEGTGIVTLAVYGEDDFRVMNKHSVQLVYHVDDEGKLKKEVTPWAGMFMLNVNPLVNEDLAKRGLIYHDEERLHMVPVCYRCETRLYHAPVPAWFIDVQKVKPALLSENENINWYPDHLKYGRFGKGVETAPDWNISRSRYWGTPMPVWRGTSDKGQMTRIIGSLGELKNWAVDPTRVAALTDIHREFLDDIEVWVDDAKTVKGRRIPEVFDCWVESGSMPFASQGLTNKPAPAQFIAEYIAQTRAWFYTLHVMSVGLFGKHTFENAVTTGTILAEDGTKMSKSRKNYPDPSILFEKYGVDALRFYLMSSVVMKGENLNFSEKQVSEVYQKVIQILWNTFSFYKLYVPKNAKPQYVAPVHVMDKWLVSVTYSLVKSTTLAMDAYDTALTCRLVGEYVNALSTWYLRRSRERLKTDAVSGQLFGWALQTISTVLAPIMPFVTERIYQNLVVTNESVHLVQWPSFEESAIDVALENNMNYGRLIVEKIHAKRKEKNIPVRQPLASGTVASSHAPLPSDIVSVLCEEVNVNTLTFTNVKDQGEMTVTLDTNLTHELMAQGQARELVRKIQAFRKNQGLAVDKKIRLQLPKEYEGLPKSLLDGVLSKTLVESVVWGDSLLLLTG